MGGESKKTTQKKQNKTIEDKTFGLKNKNKSKNVQNFVQQITTQVKAGNVNQAKYMDEQFMRAKLKKQQEEEEALMKQIYQTVEKVKVIKVDDQEIKIKICPFFRQGLCTKGKKCKLSHDLTSEQKSEDIDLYTDQRNQMTVQNKEETIDDWDENKLKEVVAQQESKYKMQKPTEIVCKYFLDAVENGRYGWKWICNNGMTCHYRHCLPPGFVFKKKIKNLDQIEDVIELEEILEEQKRKLDFSKGTPITLELFTAWKKKKTEQRAKEKEEKKKMEIKKGTLKGMSGRALFDYDATLFVDDDEAVEGNELLNREQSDEEQQSCQVIYEKKYEDDEECSQQEQDDQQNTDQKKQDENLQQEQIQILQQEQQTKQSNEQEQYKNKKKKIKKKKDENGIDIDENVFDI